MQVLNEFANVAHRKFRMPWPEVADVLQLIRRQCVVHPLTPLVHAGAIALVQRHALARYDALLVAAAADAGCSVLYSEDVQDGQRMTDALVIRNPFTPAATRTS